MVDVMGEFDRLCSEAMAAYDEELEFSYEEALLRILDFVKENPASKKEFVSGFKSILMSANSAFEAVAFCMRELQWPEIKEFVVLQMNPAHDPRSEALRSALTAYDEFWPDADFYAYYTIGPGG